MTRILDLADIQGNILRPYGRLGFPKARFIFLHIADAAAGRDFLWHLAPKITTSTRWESKEAYPGQIIQHRPEVTFNVAFTFYGLVALDLPTTTLAHMPPEFIDGMAERANILGDLHGANKQQCWDDIWQNSAGDSKVHMMISLNAQMHPDGTPVAALASATEHVMALAAATGGKVRVLPGNGPDKALYQDSAAILDSSIKPTAQEHFGFTDGFGDPVFDGQYPVAEIADKAVGGGKIMPDQSWAPLATGEFLLGHPDEAQEIPGGLLPPEFVRNGTFMAYRKLQENVGAFHDYIDRTAILFARVMGVADLADAREILMAKIAGRWSDGVPLMAAPTLTEWRAFQAREAAAEQAKDKAALAAIERSYVDFKYRADPAGLKCPVAAHMRRANTRDMLDPTGSSADPKDWNGSVLNNRRRILRRGLPYGPPNLEVAADGEQGIIFMALCASLFRQFEFVQQQWMQYGLDFNVGNDTCPLVGNHGEAAKFIIPADPAGDKPPFICDRPPQFVDTRGGDYFFIPSMTALRMIAMGTVDPT
jgi:deferrochelatase/peroxidase EfeB